MSIPLLVLHLIEYTVCMLSHFSWIWLFVTLWTVARQAPLSLGFSRQEYWSGLPCLLQGIFPTQGSNPGFPYCRQILYWQPPGKPCDYVLFAIRILAFECVWLFATPWTVAYQAPLSLGFSRQEYWSGLPCLLQGIFPTQGLNLNLLHCRCFLYCLSHQGSPFLAIIFIKYTPV